MQKQIEQLVEFQKTFNSPVRDQVGFPDKERCDLRVDLIEEELEELKEAIDAGDITKALDALIDIMYVTIGTGCEFGLHPVLEEAFDEVHRSNMSKTTEDGQVITREDGKILKSDRYEEPNLNEIIGELMFERAIE